MLLVLTGCVQVDKATGQPTGFIWNTIGAPKKSQTGPIGLPVALSTWTQPVKTNSIATPMTERAIRLIEFTVFIPSLKIIPFYSTVFLENIQ